MMNWEAFDVFSQDLTGGCAGNSGKSVFMDSNRRTFEPLEYS
jgi:hypothetical protein